MPLPRYHICASWSLTLQDTAFVTPYSLVLQQALQVMLQEHGCSAFHAIKTQGLLDSMLPPPNVFCVTDPTPYGMCFPN